MQPVVGCIWEHSQFTVLLEKKYRLQILTGLDIHSSFIYCSDSVTAGSSGFICNIRFQKEIN